MRKFKLYLYAMIFLYVFPGISNAAQLDQYNDVIFDDSLASQMVGTESWFKIDIAQTFTVGINGWLDEFQIYAQPYHPRPGTTFQFDIRPIINGVPVEDNSATLIEYTIPVEDFVPNEFGYVSFDLSAFHLEVAPGDVLAAVLRSDNEAANVNGNINDPYSDGRAYSRYLQGTTDNTWSSVLSGQADRDFGFMTFVDPWDEKLTTSQYYTTDYLTLGDKFTFDYWWEMGMEPTDGNFDVLFFNGTEWETFGWRINFDGSSEEWQTASFWVPEWARGLEAQIMFRVFDFGQETDPAVYLRNISSNSAPVPEPATMLLLGTGLMGLVATSRKKFLKK